MRNTEAWQRRKQASRLLTWSLYIQFGHCPLCTSDPLQILGVIYLPHIYLKSEYQDSFLPLHLILIISVCIKNQNLCLLFVWMSICLNNFLSKISSLTFWVDVFSSPLQYINNLIAILFFLFQPRIFAVFYSCTSYFAHDLLGFKFTLINDSDLFRRTCDLKFIISNIPLTLSWGFLLRLDNQDSTF